MLPENQWKLEKYCPMCGAKPGEPCAVIAGGEGLAPGDERPDPHFYRSNDHAIAVAIKDEPDHVSNPLAPSARGERWTIEVHHPEPGATYPTTSLPNGLPMGFAVRWVAELTDNDGYGGPFGDSDLTYHFALTRTRAIKKAQRHIRRVEKYEASQEEVDA